MVKVHYHCKERNMKIYDEDDIEIFINKNS